MTHFLIVEGSSSHGQPFELVTVKSLWSTTGRNLSPLLQQELANLDNDGDSRKSAMSNENTEIICHRLGF
ncbi:hypothetical protein OIU74_024090 [Salix koriyanagi]|uniref:Uncharacterized protein n=1 Tax=Salix koriyanagi TaxID=2511006 RepID=A0A9Q0NX18_9ROSI|nr:hypothetical protein OIU74_024090 [Salix koriyanagi]